MSNQQPPPLPTPGSPTSRTPKRSGCSKGCLIIGGVGILLFAIPAGLAFLQALTDVRHKAAELAKKQRLVQEVEPREAADLAKQKVEERRLAEKTVRREMQALYVTPARSASIDVQNLIVKRVTVDGFLGQGTRFRYFFAVRNTGAAPFNGTVEIRLLNKMRGVINGNEGFQCNIQPGLQGVGYIDAQTGPEQFHGDASVAGFSYVATVGDTVVAEGRGVITAKFEDLSNIE